MKVNILKENRATVEMPLASSSTVPSVGFGHLEGERSDDVTGLAIKY